MSSIPVVYRNTDPGAPVLNGQVGSLLSLLHAVLVTGYGSGETAKPGAGWTRPFSSPTVHVYRNSPVNGSGAYLRVRDDASAAMLNSASLAQAFAYSTMSDIDTGENKTPSTALQARGSLIAKAPPNNTTARRWLVVASDIGFYLFVDWSVSWGRLIPYYFGDVLSAVSGDPFPFALFGSGDITNYTAGWNDRVRSLFFATNHGTALPDGIAGDEATAGYPGGFIMRSYADGLGAPGRVATVGIRAEGNRYSYGSDAYPAVPDRSHGGYNFMRAVVKEAPWCVRGHLPGVLVPLHARPYADGARISFIEGIGPGDWLAVNFNVAEPDIEARSGQVLIRLDVGWK